MPGEIGVGWRGRQSVFTVGPSQIKVTTTWYLGRGDVAGVLSDYGKMLLTDPCTLHLEEGLHAARIFESEEARKERYRRAKAKRDMAEAAGGHGMRGIRRS